MGPPSNKRPYNSFFQPELCLCFCSSPHLENQQRNRMSSGYMVFCKENRSRVAGMAVPEQGKRLGAMWKKLSAAEKASFASRASRGAKSRKSSSRKHKHHHHKKASAARSARAAAKRR